jgi:hypothetical protein
MHDAGDTGRTRADTPPNPSRRGLLAGTTAVALVAATAAVTAAAGAPSASVPDWQDADSPDAELISLCDRLVTLEAARRTILYAQHTTEDELRTEPELDAVCDEQQAVFDRITALPEPVTLAGGRAMARAALSEAPIDHDGNLSPMDNAEWLAFGAITFLAASRPAGENRSMSARKPSEPDAELLAMCAAFHDQHAAVLSAADSDLAPAAVDKEDELMAANDKRWKISDQIKDIPAATAAGGRAKAGVAAVLLQENGADEPHTDGDKKFAYAVLLDIAGRPAA